MPLLPQGRETGNHTQTLRDGGGAFGKFEPWFGGVEIAHAEREGVEGLSRSFEKITESSYCAALVYAGALTH